MSVIVRRQLKRIIMEEAKLPVYAPRDLTMA
jgi:hypothetical protein